MKNKIMVFLVFLEANTNYSWCLGSMGLGVPQTVGYEQAMDHRVQSWPTPHSGWCAAWGVLLLLMGHCLMGVLGSAGGLVTEVADRRYRWGRIGFKSRRELRDLRSFLVFNYPEMNWLHAKTWTSLTVNEDLDHCKSSAISLWQSDVTSYQI